MAFRCFIVAQLLLCGLSARVRLSRTKKQLIALNQEASVGRTEPSVTSGAGEKYYTQEMKLEGSAPAQGVKTYATDSGDIDVNCFEPGKNVTEEKEKTRRVRVRIHALPEGAAITLSIDCTCYDLVAGRLSTNPYGMRLQLNYLSSEAPSNIDIYRQYGPAFKPEGVAQEVVFMEPDSKTYFGWATAYVNENVLYLMTHELTYADAHDRTGAEVVDCGEIEGAVVRISNFVRKGLNCKCPGSWNVMDAKAVVYCDEEKVAENTFKAGSLAACPSRWYCSSEKKDRSRQKKEAEARKNPARIENGRKIYNNRLNMLGYIDPFKARGGGREVVQKGTYAFNLWTGEDMP